MPGPSTRQWTSLFEATFFTWMVSPSRPSVRAWPWVEMLSAPLRAKILTNSPLRITAGVAMTFLGRTNPDLVAKGAYPKLEALAAKCEALPAFKASPLEAP